MSDLPHLLLTTILKDNIKLFPFFTEEMDEQRGQLTLAKPHGELGKETECLPKDVDKSCGLSMALSKCESACSHSNTTYTF